MVTTVLVLEILVMGTLALGWLSLLCLRLGFLDPGLFAWLMSQPTQWQVLSALIALALIYQLGSILNTVTYGALEWLRGREIKDRIFEGEYHVARGLVFQSGSSHFLQDLDYQLRFIRLARSGIVNFAMLGACALSFGGQYIGLGILSLALGALCYPAWRTIYFFYYTGIHSVFKVIKTEHEANLIGAKSNAGKDSVLKTRQEGAPNPVGRADG